jgi:dUTP pyrophosphatase
MKPRIETKILNPLIGNKIPLPDYATEGAAGMDIRACIDEAVVLKARHGLIIPAGFALSIHDKNLCAILAPRSGLGIKHGIILSNNIGVIDSCYQGEIQVGLFNRSAEDFLINQGDRICQLLFMPVVQVALTVVADFSQTTVRGTGGLGHTGLA